MNVATICRCVGSATLLGIVAACSGAPTTPAAGSTPTFTLAISGADLIAVVGGTATLTATMTQGGQTTDVTSSARWVSDDTSAVALDGPGRIRAVAPGGSRVWVTYENSIAATRIVVASALDCFPYNPDALSILEDPDTRADWVLISPAPPVGYWLMVGFVHAQDAEDGLTVGRHHRVQCYAGRNYGGADRASFIVPYWEGDSGPMPPLHREDCETYNRANLRVAQDAPGWSVMEGTRRIARLFFESDAGRILEVARRHDARCYIGRGRTYPNGVLQATSYFR